MKTAADATTVQLLRRAAEVIDGDE